MSRRKGKLIGANHERFSDLKLWSFSLHRLFCRSAGDYVENQTKKKIQALLVKPVFRIRKVINRDCEPNKSVAKNLRHFAQDSQRTRIRAYCSHWSGERLIYCKNTVAEDLKQTRWLQVQFFWRVMFRFFFRGFLKVSILKSLILTLVRMANQIIGHLDSAE